MKADHIAMPFTPNVLVTLGSTPPNTRLTNGEVDYYNDVQWSTFDTWIVARPGGAADQRLKGAAGQSS